MMQITDITEEFLRSTDIHTVLPQQEPFVMVGRLTRFDLGSSTTETVFREDNIFVDDGFLSTCGLLENIAQTCAARIGFYNKYILGNDVKVGFIGAVRDYGISGRVPVGEVVETTVDVLEEVFGMTLATAEVRCGGSVVATASIKLAISDGE